MTAQPRWKKTTTPTPESLRSSRGGRRGGGAPSPRLPPSSAWVKSFASKSRAVTFVCVSQLVPAVLQGSHLGLIHHSSNYGKPLVSRLGTCKFFVASRLAYKAERAGFYAQLNIDDSPCYSWWMSFIIRWCHRFRLLMRVENRVLSPHCRFLRRLIFGRQRGADLQNNSMAAGGMNKHHGGLSCWKNLKQLSSRSRTRRRSSPALGRR